MAFEIRIPRLGWTMEEGTFIGWLKQDGDAVRAGEPIFELEGDKALQAVEATDAGILRIAPDAPKPGEIVPVGRLLGYVVAEGEAAPFAASPSEMPSASAPPLAPRASPSARKRARELQIDLRMVAADPSERITPSHVPDVPALATASATAPRRRQTASPRARRVAAELGIDWTTLTGTGRTGRIRERDVVQAARSRGRDGGPSPQQRFAEANLTGRTLPLSPLRRTIAQRMLAGAQQTAPVTLTTKVDATNLVNLRSQFKAAALPDDVVPTYTDLLVKLAAAALQQHPLLMAQWHDHGLFIPDEINIAFAVDTDDGLFAPVLHNVPALTLRQLAALARTLADKAQRRALTSNELHGATFTLTNLGRHGIDAFTPIINPPQSAVLGIGRIHREPAVLPDNSLAPCDLLTLSLTFDHRILDGAPAARFLETLCRCVENPVPWVMA